MSEGLPSWVITAFWLLLPLLVLYDGARAYRLWRAIHSINGETRGFRAHQVLSLVWAALCLASAAAMVVAGDRGTVTVLWLFSYGFLAGLPVNPRFVYTAPDTTLAKRLVVWMNWTSGIPLLVDLALLVLTKPVASGGLLGCGMAIGFTNIFLSLGILAADSLHTRCEHRRNRRGLK